MASTVAIDFTGLCAVALGPQTMEAILLDATKLKPVGSPAMALIPHDAYLDGDLADVQEQRDPATGVVARPTLVVARPSKQLNGGVDQVGLWDLAGCEVRLRFVSGPVRSASPSLKINGPT